MPLGFVVVGKMMVTLLRISLGLFEVLAPSRRPGKFTQSMFHERLKYQANPPPRDLREIPYKPVPSKTAYELFGSNKTRLFKAGLNTAARTSGPYVEILKKKAANQAAICAISEWL